MLGGGKTLSMPIGGTIDVFSTREWSKGDVLEGGHSREIHRATATTDDGQGREIA